MFDYIEANYTILFLGCFNLLKFDMLRMSQRENKVHKHPF